ncbi:MAG: HAMP domain-containing histidine kinase [Deltaproteobacteria bacterium]|nr:HAMP domain-containing histidine kinase [Deltaproteobacteria bacterium]
MSDKTKFREKLYEATLFGFGKILSKYNVFAYDTIVKDVGYEVIQYLKEEGYSIDEANDLSDIHRVIDLFVENGFVDKLEVVPAEKGHNFIWHNLYGMKAYEKLQHITHNPFLSCPLNASLVYIANRNGKSLKLHNKVFHPSTRVTESQEEIVDRNPTDSKGFDPIVIENARLYELAEERNQELNKEIALNKNLEKELRNLNKHLEARVEAELKKRQESEQIAVQQSKMAAMGEMMSLIAHQWKQPLSAIAGVKMIFDLNASENPDFCENIKGLFDIIGEQVQYLTDTVNDFSDFLKPTKTPLNVNLNQIIDQSLKIISKSLEIESIEVVKNYDFNKNITTFPNEIVQVIINLLRNSIDAVKSNQTKDPKVYILGRQTDSYQELEIIDNGGGIKVPVIDEIFNQYFTTKDDAIGTGLGLYMSKIIIDKHCQGRLSASNKDQGACFTIRLPLNIEQV